MNKKSTQKSESKHDDYDHENENEKNPREEKIHTLENTSVESLAGEVGFCGAVSTKARRSGPRLPSGIRLNSSESMEDIEESITENQNTKEYTTP